jgi:hypothetical protein
MNQNDWWQHIIVWSIIAASIVCVVKWVRDLFDIRK